MKNTIHNLGFRVKSASEPNNELILELEKYVREVDSQLGNLLEPAEYGVNHQTYEKLRQAACLIRVALNELYDLNKKIGA